MEAVMNGQCNARHTVTFQAAKHHRSIDRYQIILLGDRVWTTCPRLLFHHTQLGVEPTASWLQGQCQTLYHFNVICSCTCISTMHEQHAVDPDFLRPLSQIPSLCHVFLAAAPWCWLTDWIQLWFYVPLDTKQVIPERFPQANLLA